MRAKFPVFIVLFLFFTNLSLQAKAGEYVITIDISKQKLYLIESTPSGGIRFVKVYSVSTSKYGTGNQRYSKKTPLGSHFIFKKIGEGEKIGTIFKGRKATGEIARIYTDATDLEEELITSRILWLKGIEPGINEGGNVDSLNRFIYIHGTPEEGLIGRPASTGCIRMKNRDIIELFDLVVEGTLVEIHK